MTKQYLAALACALFLSACGSSGSDSEGGGFSSFGSEFFDDPANAPAAEVMLTGDWSLKLTVLKDGCEEYSPGDSDSGSITITQTNNDVTISGFENTSGVVSGNKLYIEEKDAVEQSRAVLTINKDANPQTVVGESKWKYNDGEFACEGANKIEATCTSGNGTGCVS